MKLWLLPLLIGAVLVSGCTQQSSSNGSVFIKSAQDIEPSQSDLPSGWVINNKAKYTPPESAFGIDIENEAESLSAVLQAHIKDSAQAARETYETYYADSDFETNIAGADCSGSVKDYLPAVAIYCIKYNVVFSANVLPITQDTSFDANSEENRALATELVKIILEKIE